MPLLQDAAQREMPSLAGGLREIISPIPIQTQVVGSLGRRVSEESIRTELCEGPLPDSPKDASPPVSPGNSDLSHATSDRAELIERLKRGESPTWIPNRHVRFSSTPVTLRNGRRIQ
jgi:hypothetical protein